MMRRCQAQTTRPTRIILVLGALQRLEPSVAIRLLSLRFGGAKNWRHGAKGGDQIIVTNEYTVRVDEEADSGTPGRYAGR